MKPIYLFIIAGIMLALIPMAPKMLELRIRILRFMRLNRLADWHHRHSMGFILAGRLIMVAMAVLLVFAGIGGW